MAVETLGITSGPYTGDGTEDTYYYEFKIADDSQLIVFETDDEGNETKLYLDTDYTVTGVGEDTGGTVVRVAGNLPDGYTWYIRSNYIETQLIEFSSQGPFSAQVHEDAFDKLTFLIQQLLDLQERSVSFRIGYFGDASPELPEPESLKLLRWDADGTALENADGPDEDYIPDGVLAVTNLFQVADQRTEGTDGGTLVAGWQAREINTVKHALTGCSVADDQVTLPAGTYKLDAIGVIYTPDGDVGTRLVLYNVTDGAVEVEGFSSALGCRTCKVQGEFIISTEKVFEFRQYAWDGLTGQGNPLQSTNGLGYAVSSGSVEEYLIASFWKVA